MKITVNQALRLKNEIGKAINSLYREFTNLHSQYSYGESEILTGTEYLDNEEQTKSGVTSQRAYDALIALLDYSEEINNKLAEFNIQEKVSHSVRNMSNLDMRIDALEALLKASNKTEETVFNKEEGKNVKKKFEPFHTKSDLRIKIKDLKKDKRQLQSKVEQENVKEISLNFSYSDFEDHIIV